MLRPIANGLILALAIASAAQAQQTPALTAKTLEPLTLRILGPAATPGRIADIAVDPKNPSTWYIATASSGLWKTTNRGTSFQPVFDDYGSSSLGCVTVDPNNSDILWLGTGEDEAQRSVGFGDGLYKSTNAGQTWTKAGLPNSEHIGKIIVDPADSNVVYGAAQGPLWSPGGDRGLYKTTDGGTTWKPLLQISENTGVTDIIMDPRDHNVLYAASYQRRRNVGVLVGGGPEAALFKSTDAGAHWTKLIQGLPTGDIGRIALAISNTNPDIIYAYYLFPTAQAARGGFYKSSDKGATWTRQGQLASADPQYYGKIYADPIRPDHLFVMDMNVHETADGGQSFQNVNWPNVHVDNHALWLDPKDPAHMIEGNDGGLYESNDQGRSWRHFTNMPTTQFYRVGTDNALPFYNIGGGTQDNGSSAGPSRTPFRVGIRNSDWISIGGGDGFQSRFDPEDPAIVYSMSQNGAIQRLDKRTSTSRGIQPTDSSGSRLRWTWDAPFIISSHAHSRLYMAANKIFRSDNRGDAWTAISPDLTRQFDPMTIPVMGKVWDANAPSRNLWTTPLSVIVSIAESPLKEDTLAAGTDDGLVQITDDGGKNWRKIDSLPGVPEGTYVSCLAASQHDPNTLFAAFNNYQRGDFKPYLLKSTDLGKSWTSITSDLPDRQPLWCILEDPVNANLLFAGTEFGLFCSVDAGAHWLQLKGGVPTIPFKDLAIQTRESDLVCATFGRGMMILDDITPLRTLTAATLAKDVTVFPMRRAQAFYAQTYVRNLDMFTAPNPPDGAIITYYLNHEMSNGAAATAAATTAGDPAPAAPARGAGGGRGGRGGFGRGGAGRGPTGPTITLNITSDDGAIVRTLDVPATAGLHRVAWDLRTSVAAARGPLPQGQEFDPDQAEDESADADTDVDVDANADAAQAQDPLPQADVPPQTEPGARGGRGGRAGGAGGAAGRGGRGGGGAAMALVKPGTYTITVGRTANGAFTPLADPQKVQVVNVEIPTQPNQK